MIPDNDIEFSDRADSMEYVNLFVELFRAIHSHKVIL